MLRSRAVLFALAVWACSLGVLACDQGSRGASEAPASDSYGRFGPPPPLPSASASAAPSASASDAGAPPPHHHHVSVAGILLGSTRDVTLTPEQAATLAQADAQLYPDGALSPWQAVRRFQSDLVAGIRARKIDRAKLKADDADIDKAVAAGQAAEAAELDTLHGMLDAAARQSLCDTVKTRRAIFDPPPAPLAQPGAAPALPDGGAADWTKRHLDRLATTLFLDDTQKSQVAALLARQDVATGPAVEQARHDGMRRRIDALLAAFPADSFVAEKLDLSGPTGRSPHARLDEAATFAVGLLPILRLGQVLQFADQTGRSGSQPERFIEDIDPSPRRAPPLLPGLR